MQAVQGQLHHHLIFFICLVLSSQQLRWCMIIVQRNDDYPHLVFHSREKKLTCYNPAELLCLEGSLSCRTSPGRMQVQLMSSPSAWTMSSTYKSIDMCHIDNFSGEYVCVASNSLGEGKSPPVDIQVLCKFHTHTHHQSVSIGFANRMKCFG